MDTTCGVYGTVNFGGGIVTVQCVETTPHERHRFAVVSNVAEGSVQHQNVFDKGRTYAE